MMIKFPVVYLALALLMSACTAKKPVVAPGLILRDATSFGAYKEKYVRLYQDYTALDEQAKPIGRETFLRA